LWFEFGSYSVEFLSSIIDVVDKSIKYFLDTTRTLRDPHPLSLPLRQKKAGEGWESCRSHHFLRGVMMRSQYCSVSEVLFIIDFYFTDGRRRPPEVRREKARNWTKFMNSAFAW